MKLIYMAQTINIMATQNLEAVNALISTGTVKPGEFGNYLVIETKEKEQI